MILVEALVGNVDEKGNRSGSLVEGYIKSLSDEHLKIFSQNIMDKLNTTNVILFPLGGAPKNLNYWQYAATLIKIKKAQEDGVSLTAETIVLMLDKMLAADFELTHETLIGPKKVWKDKTTLVEW